MSGRPRPQTELFITIRLSAATFMFGGAAANRRLKEIEARLPDASQYVTEKG